MMENENRYKLTLEMEDRKIAVEFPPDLDIFEISDILRLILKGMTFTNTVIEKVLPEED